MLPKRILKKIEALNSIINQATFDDVSGYENSSTIEHINNYVPVAIFKTKIVFAYYGYCEDKLTKDSYSISQQKELEFSEILWELSNIKKAIKKGYKEANIIQTKNGRE